MFNMWFRRASFVFAIVSACATQAEIAESLPAGEETPLSELTYEQRQVRFCEKVVNSETCSQFRLDRPDLKDQFLRCDGKNPGQPSDLKACGKGLWNAAKDYLSIFEAPKLSPIGETFIEFQTRCFADLKCREKAYLQGVGKTRKVPPEELQKLAKVPVSQRLQVQPYYYGLLEQLKGMKAHEQQVMAMGMNPATPEGTKVMQETYPNWKPELRRLYVEETWGESAFKTVSAISQRLKELGIELQCLDSATVTEMICFGGGMLVDPLIAVKAVTALPKAYRVVSKLLKADGTLMAARTYGVEAKWGRKLTAEEKAAIDEAHAAIRADETGGLPLGKDGINPAGVGNYTPAQLRTKYALLKDKFSPEEIRDIMETGDAGMTPREAALLRAKEMAEADAKVRAAKLAKNSPVQNPVEKPRAQKNRRIVQDSVPSKEYAKSTMDDLAKVDGQTSDLLKEVDALGKEVNRFPELNDLKKQLAGYDKRKDEIFENWNTDSKISTDSTRKEIHFLEERIAKARAEVEIWKKRETMRDWKDVREAPRAVVPDRVYSVQTDRGETIKISFNDRVVRDMMWDPTDDLRSKAGSTSVEALARGWQTKEGSNGINMISLDGDKMIKINITGKSLGAYRIYGMERDGVIHFVNWEHESVHDSKYLRRAFNNTKRAFEQLPKK